VPENEDFSNGQCQQKRVGAEPVSAQSKCFVSAIPFAKRGFAPLQGSPTGLDPDTKLRNDRKRRLIMVRQDGRRAN
jgi:hypothetical protein